MVKDFPMDCFTPAPIEDYDRWYADPLGAMVDRWEKEAVFALLPEVTGLRILDAGCGTGNFTMALASQGARLVGLDLSRTMLTQARKKAGGHCAHIFWTQGDLHHLPFLSATFDGVLAILSLDFIASRAAALREMVRVLRPGGFLVVAILNRYSLWTLKRKARAWLKPSLWRQVDFLSAAALNRLLKESPGLQKFQWHRAVFGPPCRHPFLVRLAPWWERWGARLWPKAAAFLVVKARRYISSEGNRSYEP